MSEHDFEPEVVALLDEIARSPEGSLLRIPKGRLLRFVGRPQETLSPYGSHLSKAEKHLVTAYREQAARVLLEACILKLKEDPLVLSSLNPDPKELARTANAVSSRLAPVEGATEVLRGFALGNTTSGSSLAVASLLLAKSELAFNCLAVAHQEEGHVLASMRVLRQSFDSMSSSRQRAQACANLARAHAMRKQFQKAFELGHEAGHLDPSKPRYIVWCMTDALQGGDEARALQCAREIDCMPSGTDELVRLGRGLRLSRANGSWTPTPASLRLVLRIRESMSARSGAICDTFS